MKKVEYLEQKMVELYCKNYIQGSWRPGRKHATVQIFNLQGKDELLHEIGYPLFNIKHKELDLGEVVKLGFEGVLCFALHDNDLTAIAQEFSVEFFLSVDAAALPNSTIHIFSALKNVDSHLHDCFGNLMYVPKKIVIKISNLQSKINIYIMMMVYSWDGKKNRNFFK